MHRFSLNDRSRNAEATKKRRLRRFAANGKEQILHQYIIDPKESQAVPFHPRVALNPALRSPATGPTSGGNKNRTLYGGTACPDDPEPTHYPYEPVHRIELKPPNREIQAIRQAMVIILEQFAEHQEIPEEGVS